MSPTARSVLLQSRPNFPSSCIALGDHKQKAVIACLEFGPRTKVVLDREYRCLRKLVEHYGEGKALEYNPPSPGTPFAKKQNQRHQTSEMEIEMSIEPLINAEVAAQILHLHPRTVKRLSGEGVIPGMKIGKLWRYRASSLDEWAKSQIDCFCHPLPSREEK
jgi:excisionase family DNA binding protein